MFRMPELEGDLVPKELSWLSFNARVLQEARDPSVPLIERVRFLGIYSSNLDEFFRVRVATLRRLCQIGDRARTLIGHDPAVVLEQVQRCVIDLHKKYNNTYNEVIAELASNRIFLVNEQGLDEEQVAWIESFFYRVLQAELSPILLDLKHEMPSLQDRSIYLAVVLSDSRVRRKKRYALIELPRHLDRFIVLPKRGRETTIIMIDDVIRLMLPSIFSLFRHDTFQAWTIKLTRDAELDLDDDVSLSYSEKLMGGLKKREKGLPVRFVYDETIEPRFLSALMKRLGVSRNDTLLPGGRYHNRRDLIDFPEVGSASLRYPPLEQVDHSRLPHRRSKLTVMRKQDLLLHTPYNPFQQFVSILREAALDPRVRKIKTTLYRLARNSDVIRALITARRNGKQVTAVVELQARFDERANLHWAEELAEEGVEVIFGVAGLKVHSKLVLIEREEKTGRKRYACIGTGNFNEDTSRTFEDLILLTCHEGICREVAQLFRFFSRPFTQLRLRHLVVSPWNSRDTLKLLIDKETSEAGQGREADIHLKMNNLGDAEIVRLLYRAAAAGVKVRLNVRGMFTARPGEVPGTENMESMAIIDRYLEHSRIWRFHNGGDPRYYLGSADILPRNFERRVEVMVPVYDPSLRAYLDRMLDLYWQDDRKARLLDGNQQNRYRDRGKGERVQKALTRLNRELHEPASD